MNEKYNIKNWIKHLFVVPWTLISNSFDRKMIEFQLFRVCALASFSKWIHKSTENKWNITYLKRQWNTVMLACCMHTSSICILPSSPTEKKTQRRQMPNYRLAQSDQIDEVERRMHNTRSEKMTSKVDVCCLCICFVCM